MMEPDKTKEMSGNEVNVKQKTITPKKLRCVREADMPGVGLFHVGDVIEDPQIVEAIADNPNFEDISEGGSL